MSETGDAQPALVQTEALSKFYGTRRGIEALDLQIGRGEIFALLGPNGAGKTTTLRLLLGFLRPTAGRATIDGLDCWRQRHEILRGVGYVTGHVRLYEHMRADRLIRLINNLHGGDRLHQAYYIAERLRLDPTLKIRKYSRGNKQKLAIVLAMMHAPQLLVFDEPTISLDPIIADEVHHLLREAREDGATVLFSSHVLAEVEKICDRVGVLREGRLIATQRTEDFRRQHLQRLIVTFAAEPADCPPQVGLRMVRRVNRHRIEYAVAGEVTAALGWLTGQNVANVEITWPRMEEVFLSYYRDEANAVPISTAPTDEGDAA